MIPDAFVLDACALIAFFNNETGAERVEELLLRAGKGETVVFLSAINLCEIYYDCLRKSGSEKADELLEKIAGLPIVIEREISGDLIKRAGVFKVQEKVSLADAFALALAATRAGKLVSTDHAEFDPIAAKRQMEFFFIR